MSLRADLPLNVSDYVDHAAIMPVASAPALHLTPAVETMDAFELRKLPIYGFDKKELTSLYYRCFREFDTFTIFFLDEAVDEEFGFPDHLKSIGKQLIEYNRFNLFIAPRGFSKSTTISASYPIRETVYQMKGYIVIVSETMDIAQDFTETIRHELEQNPRIEYFFGKFRSKKELDDSTEKWTAADIICKSVNPRTKKKHTTRIRARGLGQQIRGKKNRHQRPDLLIFDDMESRLNTETEHQRTKAKIWFNRDALKIMDRYDSETGKGQVVVAGTIVHPESRLNNLVKNTREETKKGETPVWKMQFYKAAENHKDFKNPLWPSRFPATYLEEEKKIAEANDDLPGFLQEFFNEPIVEEDRKFKEAYFIKRFQTVRLEDYYGERVLVYEGKRYPATVSAGLDLGGWESQKSDYTGTVVLANAYDPFKDIFQGFVLEAYNERWNPDEIIDSMFDISHRFNLLNEIDGSSHFLPWTVETNAFQTLLYHFLHQEMIRRGDWTVHVANEDHESSSKDGRILSMIPVFKSKFYMFGEHLNWLVRRFIDYGLASDMHDDVEDAFQKAHRSLANPEKESVKRLSNLKPAYVKVVEPAGEFKGNWITG